MSFVRIFARPLLGSSFVAAGVDRLKHAESAGEQLEPTLQRLNTLVPSAQAVTGNAKLVGQLVGATQIAAGLMLGMGKVSRLAALLLVGTSALNAVVEYKSAADSTAEARRLRRHGLLKNLSLIGAVLLAAVDTNGRPGLAWRAGHLASDAQKQLRKAESAVRSTAANAVGR